MAACRPIWLDDPRLNGTCPYGTLVPGDVTIPNNLGVWECIALFYSFVPFVLIGCVVCYFFYNRGTRGLSIIVFTGFMTACNELGVKMFIQDPRPGAEYRLLNDAGEHVGSCATTCGMPSSHATVSIGFLTLMLLDAVIRIVPASADLSFEGDAEDRTLHPKTDCEDCIKGFNPLQVFRVHRKLSHRQFLRFAACWISLLAPVPVMRVLLNDHTLKQVIAGSALGAIYAVIFFQAQLFIAEKRKADFTKSIWGGWFIHDYGPARYFAKTAKGQPLLVDSWEPKK